MQKLFGEKEGKGEKMIEPNNYEIRRFFIPGWEIRGKKYLDSKIERDLLNKLVYIEEKVDGKFTILRNPEDEKRFLFAEDMRQTHTIYYKNLPSRFLIFDIYKKDYGFLDPTKRMELCLETGLIPVPLIYIGRILQKNALKTISQIHVSAFETELNPKMRKITKKSNMLNSQRKNFIEGIVVKLYEDGKLYAGKVVNPLFEEIIDKLGRYEDFYHRNIIKPWSYEEYKTYFQKQLMKLKKAHVNFDLKECYEIYISNFDFLENAEKTFK